jgi:hypothetical protein
VGCGWVCSHGNPSIQLGRPSSAVSDRIMGGLSDYYRALASAWHLGDGAGRHGEGAHVGTAIPLGGAVTGVLAAALPHPAAADKQPLLGVASAMQQPLIPQGRRRQNLINVVALSAAFFFLFASYTTLKGYVATTLGGNLGFEALTVLYSSYLLALLVAPAACRRLCRLAATDAP